MANAYDDFGSESLGYGSFPNDLGYDVDERESSSSPSAMDDKPRILLMGLRRSGKSSIQKVVFHKVSPNETLFLESTTKLVKNDVNNSSFVQFQIWDFPGQLDFFDPAFDSDVIFGGCGSLIFVIDAQDEYSEAIARLLQTIQNAHKVNSEITFEVFIHKVDGLSEEGKTAVQRDVVQQVTDELRESNLDISTTFYLTSIYDHSIFEAFSKVVQKLISQVATLENLLNLLVKKSSMEKAFLFDVASKIYVATDQSPVDRVTYELCSDMIDVVLDVSGIYGTETDSNGGYDEDSTSVMRLNNGNVLYLRAAGRHLALVCLLRETVFANKGLLEVNFLTFRQAMEEIFERREKEGGGGGKG